MAYPSRCGAGPNVMKNWDPLVLGPELAIDNRPFLSCLSMNASSDWKIKKITAQDGSWKFTDRQTWIHRYWAHQFHHYEWNHRPVEIIYKLIEGGSTRLYQQLMANTNYDNQLTCIIKPGMTLWKDEFTKCNFSPVGDSPFSPVQSALKLSTVFGTVSLYRANSTRWASSSPILMFMKTRGHLEISRVGLAPGFSGFEIIKK